MTERTMERLLDIEATRYGTIIEEIEIICCMTGFRRRFLVEHIGDGFYRSVEFTPYPNSPPAAWCEPAKMTDDRRG
jgi:hypothetical protein